MITLPQLVAKESHVIPSQKEEIVPEKVIPAVDEKIYDKYWITQFSFLAPSPTEEARIVATLVPARDVETLVDSKLVTVKELLPDAKNTVIVIDNIFKKSDNDTTLADTLMKAITTIINAGVEKNILKIKNGDSN